MKTSTGLRTVLITTNTALAKTSRISPTMPLDGLVRKSAKSRISLRTLTTTSTVKSTRSKTSGTTLLMTSRMPQTKLLVGLVVRSAMWSDLMMAFKTAMIRVGMMRDMVMITTRSAFCNLGSCPN
jgi:hypothetical protein